MCIVCTYVLYLLEFSNGLRKTRFSNRQTPDTRLLCNSLKLTTECKLTVNISTRNEAAVMYSARYDIMMDGYFQVSVDIKDK